MSSAYPRHRTLGPFLLAMSLVGLLLGLLAPQFAWPLAASVLVGASLFIVTLGIRQFLAVCLVTVTHFLTLVTPPYGRSELPIDFMLEIVIAPFTVASGAVAVWYWYER